MASMALQLDALERHGELVPDQDRYSSEVRAELLAMSSATIDPYLRGAKARDQIKGKSTTKPSCCWVLDQDPQGHRRGRGIAGVLRRRHRRALRADLKGEFGRTSTSPICKSAGSSLAPCATTPTLTSSAP